MRILYIAHHGPHDNEDEDAISHVLRGMGHEVICIEEKRRGRRFDARNAEGDLCLFHKCEDYNLLQTLHKRDIPLVFWYFDLVYSDDETLVHRCQSRIYWMEGVLPLVTVGFCTDGDWVEQNWEVSKTCSRHADKLVWLTQGADERKVGFGESKKKDIPPILFTGMVHHGQKRADHIEQLRHHYGNQFSVIGDNGPRHRLHGRELANLFASTRIVVAPDGPCTDHYWSNRVYLTLGLGGFLLHPRCEQLLGQYKENKEILLYDDRDDLIDLIDYYITDEAEADRQKMREAGLQATIQYNLYRHRVADMLRVVKERL